MPLNRQSLKPLMIYAIRKYGTKPKVVGILDEQISQDIENEKIKPRHHPGIMKVNAVEVPKYITRAIQNVLRDKPVKAVLEEGSSLARYLHARHPPIEEHEFKTKHLQVEQDVELRYGFNSSSMPEEERVFFKKRFQGQVNRLVQQKVYAWQPIVYDEYRSLQYLLGRSAAEHAVVMKVLNEIKARAPNFVPRTMFDFGSGVGTVTWAVRSLWKNSINEYFNIDSSSDMNDLASLVLRGGQNLKEMPLKGVFYRQFLPASHTLKYDMVVSAYSLLELPSSQTRLQTVQKLWSKTQSYLILIEQGTNAGFKVINEARDYVLHLAEETKSQVPVSSAHVFAPCPHEKPCPRFLQHTIPCNFEVAYVPLPFGTKSDIKRERFSYVILMKGGRPSDDPKWPRLVSPTLVKSKHAICRMCSPSGKLEEIIFTASKYGRVPYRCARASKWGDLLPINSWTGDSDDTAAHETDSSDDEK